VKRFEIVNLFVVGRVSAASLDVTIDETCRLSGYGVRQPLEQKKDVVPRTPNPTYGMWPGCRSA
jgi:hypothetical protein